MPMVCLTVYVPYNALLLLLFSFIQLLTFMYIYPHIYTTHHLNAFCEEKENVNY